MTLRLVRSNPTEATGLQSSDKPEEAVSLDGSSDKTTSADFSVPTDVPIPEVPGALPGTLPLPGSGIPSVPGMPGWTGVPTTPTTSAPTKKSEDTNTKWWLIGGGLAAVAAVAIAFGMGRRRRRRARRARR